MSNQSVSASLSSLVRERNTRTSPQLVSSPPKVGESPAKGRTWGTSLAVYLGLTAATSFLIGSLVSLIYVETSRMQGNPLEVSQFSSLRGMGSFLSRQASLARFSSLMSRKIPGLHRGRIQTKDPKVRLWPMPLNVSHGRASLSVSPSLEFVAADMSMFPPILQAAVERYKGLIFEGRKGLPEVPPGFSASQVLLAVEIRVLGPANESLSIGVDESYSLFVPFGESPGVLLEAHTVYGVLRGLETLSQLCQFDYNLEAVLVIQAPWLIHDKPRFPHRGLLVDTSRHYQPVAVLEEIIDAMSYSKLNVLHWHMVDQQSFPIQVPSFPKLWQGAHSERERYTMEDIAHVVKFAGDRGIVVMPEVDIPGHAASWGVGYPELWPNQECRMPLDVSRNSTFDVIRGILSDLKAVIPHTSIHLGGDEVNWGCWEKEERIASWMREHQMGPKQAYEYFVLKAVGIAEDVGWRTVTLWEETFANFGHSLDRSTVVVEIWLNKDLKTPAAGAGLRVLVSQVWEWYLDGLDVHWWKSYTLEPCSGLNDDLCSHIVGGEACMWTEHVDPGNIIGRIWPRAAAVAERLWSPFRYTNTVSEDDAKLRILNFKCLLHRRGIGSSPITVAYKTESEPASCYAT